MRKSAGPGSSAARPRVAVVGLGLVGGSLARALTRAGYAVLGVDPGAALRRALRAGAIRRGVSLARAAAESDLLVLAAPPRANQRLLRRLAESAPARLVITDVTSVKRPIVQEARRLRLRRFVGGHPLAGRESSGFQSSVPDLFRGRAWVITPEGASPAAVAAVRALARSVGARPAQLSASEHDRALAFLSHLPQLVAWALAAAAGRDRVARRCLQLAGPGYRDMTRLAGSPRPLWREILVQNRAEVERALARFSSALGLRGRASARPRGNPRRSRHGTRAA